MYFRWLFGLQPFAVPNWIGPSSPCTYQPPGKVIECPFGHLPMCLTSICGSPPWTFATWSNRCWFTSLCVVHLLNHSLQICNLYHAWILIPYCWIRWTSFIVNHFGNTLVWRAYASVWKSWIAKKNLFISSSPRKHSSWYRWKFLAYAIVLYFIFSGA
jgi:hypothetical protein